MSSIPHISAQAVTVVHRAPDGGRLPVLDAISFDVPRSQFVCIVGASGGGKSTLIRVIAGLQRPTTGTLLVSDAPVQQPAPHIGLMFQDANLMPWRTVLENIALPLELAGVDRATRDRTAENLLQMLGLAEFAQAHPAKLSGGMAQRVALGRVLVRQPEVLLLDEPFGALDALTREQVSLDLLRVCEQQQQTVVMVTHDIQEAVLLADRVLVLSKRPGQIIADIPVDLPRPRQPEMAFTPEFIALAQEIRAAIASGAAPTA